VIHEANLVDYARMNLRGAPWRIARLHAGWRRYADGIKVRGAPVRDPVAHDSAGRPGDRLAPAVSA